MNVTIKTPFSEISFEMEQAKVLKLLQMAMGLAAEAEPLSASEQSVPEPQPVQRPAPPAVEEAVPGGDSKERSQP